MKMLSMKRPRPSIEIATPAVTSLLAKASAVKVEPWTVLKIRGLPNRSSASSSAAAQKLASLVFDSRHARTARLAQSMIATRYRKPQQRMITPSCPCRAIRTGQQRRNLLGVQERHRALHIALVGHRQDALAVEQP